MYAFEPQLVLMAVGLFFTVIGATWVVWKTISESQAKTEKSFGELRADTHRSQAEMIKSFGELKADTAKSFGESQARTERSFGEVRVDIKGLGTRMDCLDKHMDTRMGGLEGEVRGINEFLRRESVKDIESDKES